jgi:hypothetical protein
MMEKANLNIVGAHLEPMGVSPLYRPVFSLATVDE